jgi:hypothetical protein
MTKFSGNCYALLTLYDVQRTAGYTIGGKTAFIVGVPDKSIGRLSYLNCRYGVPAAPKGATPQIEMTVALYGTSAQAEKRAAGTVSDYVANGATATQVTAGHFFRPANSGGEPQQVGFVSGETDSDPVQPWRACPHKHRVLGRDLAYRFRSSAGSIEHDHVWLSSVILNRAWTDTKSKIISG